LLQRFAAGLQAGATDSELVAAEIDSELMGGWVELPTPVLGSGSDLVVVARTYVNYY